MTIAAMIHDNCVDCEIWVYCYAFYQSNLDLLFSVRSLMRSLLAELRHAVMKG